MKLVCYSSAEPPGDSPRGPHEANSAIWLFPCHLLSSYNPPWLETQVLFLDLATSQKVPFLCGKCYMKWNSKPPSRGLLMSWLSLRGIANTIVSKLSHVSICLLSQSSQGRTQTGREKSVSFSHTTHLGIPSKLPCSHLLRPSSKSCQPSL